MEASTITKAMERDIPLGGVFRIGLHAWRVDGVKGCCSARRTNAINASTRAGLVRPGARRRQPVFGVNQPDGPSAEHRLENPRPQSIYIMVLGVPSIRQGSAYTETTPG